MMLKWSSVLLLLMIPACMPVEQPAKPRLQVPVISGQYLRVADGEELPFREWQAKKPRAVILALHGFNDYSRSFSMFAEEMQSHRVSVVAYDQRGFGKNRDPGIWGGSDNMALDACDAVRLMRHRFPRTPLFLLGDSMGASVAVRAYQACASDQQLKGLILAAPAVWGEETMNPFYRAVLWVAAHTVPSKQMTGEGLKIRATDNREVLEEMSRDPYVIKKTRVDAVYGLLTLMDAAHADLAHMGSLPVLILYGLKDQVVPRASVDDLEAHLPEAERIDYEDGYHLLLRDMQRKKVYEDVLEWVLK